MCVCVSPLVSERFASVWDWEHGLLRLVSVGKSVSGYEGPLAMRRYHSLNLQLQSYPLSKDTLGRNLFCGTSLMFLMEKQRHHCNKAVNSQCSRGAHSGLLEMLAWL